MTREVGGPSHASKFASAAVIILGVTIVAIAGKSVSLHEKLGETDVSQAPSSNSLKNNAYVDVKNLDVHFISINGQKESGETTIHCNTGVHLKDGFKGQNTIIVFPTGVVAETDSSGLSATKPSAQYCAGLYSKSNRIEPR